MHPRRDRGNHRETGEESRMETGRNRDELKGSLLLLLGAVIWGAAFSAQRMGMDHVGPFTFSGIRMLLSGLVLIPFARWSENRGGRGRKKNGEAVRLQRKAGILCGIFLCVATALQQIGLVSVSAGKAGFITALYVVLVPIAGWLVFRKRAGWVVWIGVLIAVAALYLLCVPAGGFRVEKADILLVGCAVCFTAQILCVDRFSPKVNGFALARDEFLFSGVVCMAVALAAEPISPDGIREALIPILYTGIMSGAVAYTLQIYGQRTVDPTVASLLMCLESVFAVLTGIVLLGETMTPREAAGCLLMFTAVILAQLSPVLSGHMKPRSSR